MFLRAFILCLFPLVNYLYVLQSWEGPIVRNGIIHIIIIFVLLVVFSIFYLRRPNISTAQAVNFPLKVFLWSLLIFVIICLLLGISIGIEGLVMQLPGVITFSVLYLLKGLIPIIIVGINYVLHSKKVKPETLDEHLLNK